MSELEMIRSLAERAVEQLRRRGARIAFGEITSAGLLAEALHQAGGDEVGVLLPGFIASEGFPELRDLGLSNVMLELAQVKHTYLGRASVGVAASEAAERLQARSGADYVMVVLATEVYFEDQPLEEINLNLALAMPDRSVRAYGVTLPRDPETPQANVLYLSLHYLLRQMESPQEDFVPPSIHVRRTVGIQVVDRLRELGQTLSTAESCTGGQLAAAVTAVPGSSTVFIGGIVAYANSVKRALLAVPEDVLNKHGAVSEECARAMAAGCQHSFATDWALSTTGIAGPDGGTPDKPVGLVWFGWANSHGLVRADAYRIEGDRATVQRLSVNFSLRILLKLLRDEQPAP